MRIPSCWNLESIIYYILNDIIAKLFVKYFVRYLTRIEICFWYILNNDCFFYINLKKR